MLSNFTLDMLKAQCVCCLVSTCIRKKIIYLTTVLDLPKKEKGWELLAIQPLWLYRCCSTHLFSLNKRECSPDSLLASFFYTKAHFSFSISSRSCEADIKELPLINLVVSQQRKSTIILFWRAGQNLYGLTYADWTSALRMVLCQLGEFFLQNWWLIRTQLFLMPVCMHTHNFRAVLHCQCSAMIL